MPTGQVSRLHTRIMQQPIVISGAVAKPNSSRAQHGGDGNVAAGQELTVRLQLYARTQAVQCKRLMRLAQTQLPRQTRVLDAELRGAAPVPPSKPLISITSAWPLATPAAIVPTPASAASFTDMRASGLVFLRS